MSRQFLATNPLAIVVYNSCGRETAEPEIPSAEDDEANFIILPVAPHQPEEVIHLESTSSASPSDIIAQTIEDIGRTFSPTSTAKPAQQGEEEEVEDEQLVDFNSSPPHTTQHDKNSSND